MAGAIPMDEDDKKEEMDRKYPEYSRQIALDLPKEPAEPVAAYDWRIEDWDATKQEHKVTQEFPLLDCNWRFILFPSGHDQSGKVGIYIQPLLKIGQEIKVQYRFELTGADKQVWTHRGLKSGEHDYFQLPWNGAEAGDRGFPMAMTVSQVSEKVAKEGPLTIRFVITDFLVHAKAGHEKDVLGFVGLQNQGATCYMNSLLQTLYALPSFRKAVFNIALEDKNDTTMTDKKSDMPIAIALQKVFYKLQTANKAVSTKVLTKSFGWTSMDSAMQHDVQEFSRVLLDSLEEKTKGTALENIVPTLFQGETESYVKCVNVDFLSKRAEKFYDLALNVKGCSSVEVSINQYLAKEDLVGPNQFRADQHGLQDAIKGINFLTLPPVLQLQLKRFEYDMNTGRLTKVNDRLEFPVTLDLSQYIAGSVYHLHSVLVHSGGAYGGHYYCFIRPVGPAGSDFTKARWYKFDDSRVSPATEAQAVTDNFGGGGYSYANAYMLVYLRQDHTTFEGGVPELGTVSVAIPETLSHSLTRLKQAKNEAKLQKENEEKRQKLLMDVKLTLEVELLNEPMGLGLSYERPSVVNTPIELPQDSDLFDPLLDTATAGESEVRQVARTSTLQEWLDANHDMFVDSNQQKYTPQIWQFKARANLTERPSRPAPLDSPFSATINPHFYIRDANHDLDIKTTEKKFTILKYFDISRQCLRLLGSVLLTPPLPSAPFTLAAKLLSLKGFVKNERTAKPETWLTAYEEETGTDITSLDVDDVVDQRSGDIIVFERCLDASQLRLAEDKHAARYKAWLQTLTAPPDGSVRVHVPSQKSDIPMRSHFFPSCRDFLPFLASRLLVQLRRRGDTSNQHKSLTLQNTMDYMAVVTVVGKWLGTDPMKVRLFMSDTTSSAMECKTAMKLGAMVTCISCDSYSCQAAESGKCPIKHIKPVRCCLYFDVSEYSFDELAKSEVIEVQYVENLEATPLKLLVPKQAVVDNLLKAFRQKMSVGGSSVGGKRKAPEEDSELSVIVLKSGHELAVCQPTDKVESWNVKYLIQSLPSIPSPDSKMTWLWRIEPSSMSMPQFVEFPVPVVVSPSQTIADLKIELQARFHFDKVKLRLLAGKYNFSSKPLVDTDIIFDRLQETGTWREPMALAMEAPAQPKKSASSSYHNRGIKFYN